MYKIATKIDVGMRFALPKDWQKIILGLEMEEEVSTQYVIEEIHKKGRKTFYICSSSEEKESNQNRIAITQDIAKYLFGQKVEDLNEGFSFKEFLPQIGDELLVTNQRSIDDIIPGVLKIDVGFVEINEESLRYLFLKFEFIIGNCHTDLTFFSKRNAEYTWKLLNSDDESYMTNYEKVFKDTLIHKKYVIRSANILANYLRQNGAIIHADLLEERALVHDNSKITCFEELDSLSRIINDKTNLKNPSRKLSLMKMKSIELHWQHNSHHPEYYNSVIDMPRLDILEMCCDWHARSIQFNTNLMEFVVKQNEKRFRFPDWMFAEIMHYCSILNSASAT